MSDRVALGMLTPSSNTVLGPVTTAMIRRPPGSHGALLALQGDRDHAVAERARAIRRARNPPRRRTAGARQGQRRLSWNGILRLARLRARRDAVRADHSGDQHSGNRPAMLALNELLETTKASASASSRRIWTTFRRASMRATRGPVARLRPTGTCACRIIFRSRP